MNWTDAVRRAWQVLNTPIGQLLPPRARPSPAAVRDPRSPPRRGPGPFMQGLTDSLRGTSPRTGDQLSREDTPTGLLGRLSTTYLGFPADSRVRLTHILRALVQNDEDVSGTVGDYLAIVNPGHTIEFTGSRKAVKAARAEADAWAARIYPEGGGLDGLINNQIIELLTSPASSIEWACDETRSQVLAACIVPAERVSVGRDPATGARTYHQVLPALAPIQLDPVTYLYAPLLTMGGDPHGIPMFLSALRSLDRKGRLIENTDRVIDLMRQIALVGVELPMPTPQDVGLASADDPRYAEMKREFAEQAADMILGLAPQGLFVGPQGTKFTINNVTHSLAGLPEVLKENNRRAFTALGTTAFMRGHLDSTTEALAKVVYPMMEARATNLQAVVARQLEFGLNLHLRLRGINATAYVKFQQAESAFKQAEAEAYLTRMKAHEIGKKVAGPAYGRRFADDLDLSDDEDQHAPPWAATWGQETSPAPSPGTAPVDATRAAPARLAMHFDRQSRRYTFTHPDDAA
ncbi:hypothetical protein [uncultured Deinococcus sp.]|uniref:hypothetical protein n=1 Tax=uncultured Deinococcus sp. TaxID=158789 RepID=UPI0025D4FFBA|nr:hypothetical protein [uncultured Deinococcus sp.]